MLFVAQREATTRERIDWLARQIVGHETAERIGHGLGMIPSVSFDGNSHSHRSNARELGRRTSRNALQHDRIRRRVGGTGDRLDTLRPRKVGARKHCVERCDVATKHVEASRTAEQETPSPRGAEQ